ncbi:glutamate synthase subunit beta [Haloimpatiens sp. FM7315]|uniref:glutamate synthase subunit beta n=1 Tax=Haloimpatiens sp. FM7315 TaxID=3298609 RepID=UPI0035A30C87
MGKLGAFKSVQRKNFDKRSIEDRVKDCKEIYIPLEEGEVIEQASRCMSCGTAFCNWGCPLGNIAPDWNDMVYKGNFKKAYDRLSYTNNFPEFTSRLCPALCEAACALGVNRKAVSIREIEYSIIEKAFKMGYVEPKIPKVRTGKRVAVIGSGPAGLAASADLNAVGHSVTVFEKEDKIGGILRYGIPDFKLEKGIIDRRINILKQEGIVFKTNTNIGIDIEVKELLEEFDAVVLAGGSSVPRDLLIKGREYKGIHFAMDYLKSQNRSVSKENGAELQITGEEKLKNKKEINAKDKVVVVIGGGDTGSDCVGTAIRQRAKKVYQLEIMPKPPIERDETMPWPTYPRVLKTTTSHEEGCERIWSVGTKEIIGEEGNLSEIKCVKLQWNKDEKGKFCMKEIEGSEFYIKADLIILAMGFLHPDHYGLIDSLKVKLDSRGNVLTDDYFKTTIDKVFAAGDLRTGQSLIVKALKEGKAAAKNVDEYLMGETFLKG